MTKKLLTFLTLLTLFTTAAWAAEYVKITSATDLEDGDYLIVNTENKFAFDGSLGDPDGLPNYFEVVINSNKIDANDEKDKRAFTITSTTSGYTIKSKSGYYIGRTASSNGMNKHQTTAYYSTIEFDASGNAVITGLDTKGTETTAKLQFYDSGKDGKFRYYIKTHKSIQLYKRVETKVATPTFSVAEGKYKDAQSVTLSTTTSGASIYYTTDGTAPTTSSDVYSNPITVDRSMTIKAIGIKDGLTSSGIASATYTIFNPPTFDIPSGTEVESGWGLTVNAPDGAVAIMYTTDGSTPSYQNNIGELVTDLPFIYSFTDDDVTLKVIAIDEDDFVSNVATASYTIKLEYPRLATPTFSLEEGEYYKGTQVTINYPEGSTLVGYVNESPIDTQENPFVITIDDNMEIQAKAVQEGYTMSYVAAATYQLKSVPTPSFSPAAGAVEKGTAVTISCEDETAEVYYTTDGTDPTTDGTAYTAAFTINEAQTLKAAAKVVVNDVTTWSEVATAAYTVTVTGNATFIFNTAEGLAELGIAKPASSKGTDIGQYTYYSGIVSLSGTDGATNSRVWNTSDKSLDLRVYANTDKNPAVGTITISVPDGYLMNSIDFTFNDNKTGGLTNWTGSSASQTFTVNAPARISSIAVTYALNDASKAVTSKELKYIAASGIYKITDALTVAYVDEANKVLYLKDNNGAAAQAAASGQIDYVKDQAGLQSGDWDHSNWIAVKATEAESYTIGDQIKGIIGTVTKDGDALSMTIGDAKPIPTAGSFTPNTYIPANFTGSQTQHSEGTLSGIDYDKTYFFVTPKVNEYAKVTWAVWNGSQFVVIANSHNIVGGLSMAEGSVEASNLVEGTVYALEGIIKPVSEAKSGAPRKVAAGDAGTPAYSLQLTVDPSSNVVTGITDLTGDKAVSAVKYYNLTGVESDRPFEGVNIIVTRYTDGTSQAVKVVK